MLRYNKLHLASRRSRLHGGSSLPERRRERGACEHAPRSVIRMSLVGDYGSSSDDDAEQQVDVRAPAKLAGNSAAGGNASDDSATGSDGEQGSTSSGSTSSGENESSDTENEEERQAQRRKRQRSTNAAASTSATSGLGSVDELFAATDTAILSSSNTTSFVAPSLDVAAEEKARAEAEANARAAAAAVAPAAASAKLDVPNAQFLRDIPGDPASKNATAKDWKTKEKLKRDRGQVSRFKNYVEEEKRLLREYEGNATSQS